MFNERKIDWQQFVYNYWLSRVLGSRWSPKYALWAMIAIANQWLCLWILSSRNNGLIAFIHRFLCFGFWLTVWKDQVPWWNPLNTQRTINIDFLLLSSFDRWLLIAKRPNKRLRHIWEGKFLRKIEHFQSWVDDISYRLEQIYTK